MNISSNNTRNNESIKKEFIRFYEKICEILIIS